MALSTGNTKSFLKPTKSKIILFLFLSFYLGTTLVGHLGTAPSPVAGLLLLPLALLGESLFYSPLIIPLFFLDAYISACVIGAIFDSVKERKLLVIAVLLFFFFIFGTDEMMMGSINKPDLSCATDSDCIVKTGPKGGCGKAVCSNKNWNYYSSVINSVFGRTCGPRYMVCSCVENKCASKDLHTSTDFEDCEKLDYQFHKDSCIRAVSRNQDTTNAEKIKLLLESSPLLNESNAPLIVDLGGGRTKVNGKTLTLIRVWINAETNASGRIFFNGLNELRIFDIIYPNLPRDKYTITYNDAEVNFYVNTQGASSQGGLLSGGFIVRMQNMENNTQPQGIRVDFYPESNTTTSEFKGRPLTTTTYFSTDNRVVWCNCSIGEEKFFKFAEGWFS